MRVRVGLVMVGIFIANSVLMMPQTILDRRWALLVVELATLLLAGVALRLFRRHRSPALPATLLLSWLLLSLVAAGSVQGGIYVSISAWPGMLALLALYLLGPRRGLVFAALAVLQIAWSFALHRSGMELSSGHLSPPDSWLSLSSAMLGVAMIAALGYLYEAAQARSLGELEDALVITEHNERQLDALFESTTAAICSLDRDARLLTCNDAFRRMVAAPDAPGPQRGDALAHILPPAQRARWQPQIDRVLAGGGPTTFEEPPAAGQDGPHRETTMHPIATGGAITGVTVFSRDITARKRAEAEMRRLNQELVRVSRQAGMAAVAGEVLHNAGNVLNSTGVSVAMIDRHAQGFRFGQLAKAVAMLEEHAGHLDAFLRDDPRGSRLFELLRGLVAHFEQQQQQLGAEVSTLQQSIAHLTRVIHAQQSHARTVGVVETVTVAELIDAALDLHAPSWTQLGIEIECDIADVPALRIDKHKVIEILVNLISNARHALRDSGRPDKRLRIRAAVAAPSAGSDSGSGTAASRVRIDVADNGVGIAPAHREQLFRLGFTTKTDGTGIGLHSSANLAQQLGGALSVHSDGPGQGAVFTLELPLVPPGEAPGRPLA
jgi:two-component system sensor kinase FixL